MNPDCMDGRASEQEWRERAKKLSPHQVSDGSESLELGRKSPDLCLLAFYVFSLSRVALSLFMIANFSLFFSQKKELIGGLSSTSTAACWLDENKNKFLIAFYDVLAHDLNNISFLL